LACLELAVKEAESGIVAVARLRRSDVRAQPTSPLHADENFRDPIGMKHAPLLHR